MGEAERPKLQFGPGDLSGFTSTGLTGFQKLHPAGVVRELVQNSVDAAVEAGQARTEMRFSVHSIAVSEIPGVKEYADAFHRAKRSHASNGVLPDQAGAVARAIDDCLQKEYCEVLAVSDNGIGLNKSRMRALLADGITVKAPGATGAFGNGHMVVVPASDLRYILYGGILENGHRIASGHAILASHPDKKGKAVRSKDGFFVARLRENDFNRPFEFPTGRQMPPLISQKLDDIQTRWKHGTCVLIPGFNRFRRNQNTNLWSPISKAAACSFFSAMARDELNVEVEENGETRVLDRSTIDQVLWEHSDEQRSRGGFLSGRDAYEGFRTLRDGTEFQVTTGYGKATVYIRELGERGQTKLMLCRNGMWITNSIPTFYGKFSDREPFHCVVELRGPEQQLHSLVRKAEGPLHNDLSVKSLASDEKRRLYDAFRTIQERIRTETKEVDRTMYAPDDVFTIETSSDPELTGKGEATRRGGTPTALPNSRRFSGGQKKRKGHRTKTKKKAETGQALPIEVLSIPKSPRECSISIIPKAECNEAEFRLVLDENVDATCDDLDGSAYLCIRDASVTSGGGKISRYVKNEEGDIIGIRISGLASESTEEVHVKFDVPNAFRLSRDDNVVVLVEARRVLSNSENQDEAR